MSPSDANLKDIRARLGELVTGRKIVLMGVGNELRGDDAFGVWLGERIDVFKRALKDYRSGGAH